MAEIEDIEQGVLGALLLAGNGEDDPARVWGIYNRKGIDEKWFKNQLWKKVFKALKEEWKEHQGVDPMLVAERVGKDGSAAVSDCMSGAVSCAHAEYYADKLRDRHLYSLTHRLCFEVCREMDTNNVSLELDKLAKTIREIQGLAAKADGGLTHVSDHVPEIMNELTLLSEERVYKKNKDFFIGLPLPWSFLNEKYMGLKPGLHVIAALPSQGKTTMGVAISLFWCQKKIKHGFICIDMTAKELVKRYATVATQTSLAKMNWGGTREDVRRFGSAFEPDEKKGGAADNWNLDSVEISESVMVERIRDEAYRGVYTHGWQAIIIDYLQLVKDEFKGVTATYEQVKKVTQEIKQLSKDVNIPIICLVQLSRAFAKEARDTNRKPGLDDLGDSAEIARAASTVAVLAGDQNVRKYWDTTPPMKLAFADKFGNGGQMSLATKLRPVWYYLIKNQQGPTGEVPFVMYPNYFLFRPGDMDAEDEVIEIAGKDKRSTHPKFETIRDDWMYCESDVILEESGAMGHRGIMTADEIREKRYQAEMGVGV